MGLNIEFRDGSLRDVTYVAAHMRECDWEEISASSSPGISKTEVGVGCHDCLGWSYTTWMRGTPVIAFGFSQTFLPNVWIAWAFATKDARRAFPATGRFISREIVPKLVDEGCTRVEARVLKGNRSARSFVELLGGKTEAEMLHYGLNGETFLLVSWTLDGLPTKYA